jgi:hypothetical protein
MDVIISETVMIVSVIGLIGWILHLLSKNHQKSLEVRRLKIETLDKVFQRFSDSESVMAFLSSKEGGQVLHVLEPSGSDLRRSILRQIQLGVALLVLGAGFFINAQRYIGETDINYINKVSDLQYWGTISACFGLALFLIALITRYFGSKLEADSPVQTHPSMR